MIGQKMGKDVLKAMYAFSQDIYLLCENTRQYVLKNHRMLIRRTLVGIGSLFGVSFALGTIINHLS